MRSFLGVSNWVWLLMRLSTLWSSPGWCFIWCVRPCNGPWDTHIKHYFSFRNEISMWIGGLSRVGYPPQCGWSFSNPLRTRIEQKVERGALPHHWAGPSCLISCSCSGIYTIKCPGSQALRLGLNYATGFSRFPACRPETMDLAP